MQDDVLKKWKRACVRTWVLPSLEVDPCIVLFMAVAVTLSKIKWSILLHFDFGHLNTNDKISIPEVVSQTC